MFSRFSSIIPLIIASSRLVLSTLNEALQDNPNRKCFRLVGGVLVERTVSDVVPALQTNKEGVRMAAFKCTYEC